MSNSLTLSSLLSPWGDFSSSELDAIAVEQLELDSRAIKDGDIFVAIVGHAIDGRRFIDKAVAHGPGLRWATMGPSSLFHLGGGDKGIAGFCEHIGPPMQTWWDDLGDAKFDQETVQLLVDGMREITDKRPTPVLKEKRDALIVSFLQDLKRLEG